MPKPISRRQVSKGIAWSAPLAVSTVAAPFAAASPCPSPTQSVTFNGTQGTSQDGTRVSVTSRLSGSITTVSGGNLSSSAQNGESFIALQQTPSNTSSYQEVTFTFSRPVYSFGFSILDIDANRNPQGNYSDRVSFSVPASYTLVKGSNVIGSGSSSDPLRPITDQANPLSPTDPSAMVKVSADPSYAVTSFTVRYSSAINKLAQEIYIGGFKFC